MTEALATIRTEAVNDAPKPNRILLKKTPRQLLSLYEGRTELQADRLIEPFKGEWIRVNGRVVQLIPDSLGFTALIDVTEENQVDRVGARFIKNAERERQLLRFDTGDQITVEGRIGAEQNGQLLYLTDCEFPP